MIKKDYKILFEKFKSEQEDKKNIQQFLYNWFNETVSEKEMQMSSKGFKRFLNNLIKKKNKKIVDDAIRYLVKEHGMDQQLLEFTKYFILEDFSNLANEIYCELVCPQY